MRAISKKARAPLAPLVSVYDGRQCLGFVIPRGQGRFEAFDHNECSLGIFRTLQQAVAAIPANGAAP